MSRLLAMLHVQILAVHMHLTSWSGILELTGRLGEHLLSSNRYGNAQATSCRKLRRRVTGLVFTPHRKALPPCSMHVRSHTICEIITRTLMRIQWVGRRLQSRGRTQ